MICLFGGNNTVLKKVISLFSGIGGIDLGFQQVGFDIVWANDIDPDACKTYEANFGKGSIRSGDIRNIDINTIPNGDIIVAGFPCQPFSVCGQQKGFSDPRGSLFFEIMRIADKKSPKIIFLENVANLTEHDNGKTFNIIHNELSSRNYYLRYLVADACDYGVPQHRTRTYLIAFKSLEQCNNFSFPEKVLLDKHIFDIIDKNKRADDRYYLSSDSYQYRKLSKEIKDENWIYRFSDYGVQASKEGISFTLKANMGIWYDRIPFIKDAFGIRTVTPEECLALQGFPNTFRFPDIPIKSVYKQCGNTVCVPIIKSIAEKLFELM